MAVAKKCRREYDRFKMDSLVWWNRDWETEPIVVQDVGAGGMLCEFPTAIEPGDTVDLEFALPGAASLVHCRCQAAHCRPGEGAYYLIGLAILELEGMARDTFTRRLKEALAG